MIWGFVTPLFFGCLWIVLAAVVAMLPMRRQMVPGLILLIIAPFLLTWIAWFHGWGWAVAGIIGFASMFRNPLIYFARRALGKPAGWSVRASLSRWTRWSAMPRPRPPT